MSEAASSVSKAVSGVIDKVIEFRFFMLVMTLFFSIDSCLYVFFDKNILVSFQSLSAPESSLSSVLIFFSIYSFSMALLFPSIRRCMQLSIIVVKSWLPYNRNAENRDSDFTDPSIVFRKSIQNKDDFDYKYVKQHEEDIKDKQTELTIAFSLCMIIAINYFFCGSTDKSSISQIILSLWDSDHGIFLNGFIKLGITVFGGFLIFMGGLSLKPIDEEMWYPRPLKERSYEDFDIL